MINADRLLVFKIEKGQITFVGKVKNKKFNYDKKSSYMDYFLISFPFIKS